MQITRGKIPCAKKIIIYGPEGIGKSTLASHFPDPVFIDTEGSTKDMDVARLDAPSSWSMLMEEVRYIKQHPECLRTLVIDTADWAEMLCITHVCDKSHKDSVEEFGYGKGYVYVQEEFGRLLNLLEEVDAAGIHVVLTAHARMRKFEQPDEMGAYDRWEMKLSKGVAPMVKEWADMVLFCNYKTMVVNVDGQGAQKGKNKAQGGKRVMYTTHHNCWDAKNRYGLPDEVPFEYESIAHIMTVQIRPETMQAAAVAPTSEVSRSVAAQQPAQDQEPEATPQSSQEPAKKAETTAASAAAVTGQDAFGERRADIPEGIPKALADLMQEYKVGEWDLQAAVADRGYYPADTPIQNYDPDFISGVLVGAWAQVYELVKKIREKQEIPFN